MDGAPIHMGRIGFATYKRQPCLMTEVAEITVTPFDARRKARSLYWRGWSVSQIAEEMNLSRNSVQAWKDRGKWDDASSVQKLEDCIECRFAALVAKESKTGGDFKEIDLLGRQIAALARVRRYEEPGGHEGDLNEKVGNRNKGDRKKPKRNYFNIEQYEKLKEIFESQLFGYQRTWWQNCNRRTRMILKSRQIGATYYFAFEALLDAIETGRNQIFLSASRAQALQFRNYIIAFAKLVEVNLSGDPMLITSEVAGETTAAAEIHFLGTNFRTAQGRHGNFYFDEFFWTHGFEELNKVASGMAMHTKWRKTYFSTPSTVAHGAYPYWTGDRYNKRRKKVDRVEVATSHDELKHGLLCDDGVWRHMVTIEDAKAGGCNLFNLEELKTEYAPDEFANLLMCEFVDDTLSAFRFNDLASCGCDTLEKWADINPLAARPYGNNPVWAGYDPQESAEGDNAALVIAAPPKEPGGIFRILERHQLRGLDFQQQAEFIKSVLSRYNCTYIGIDATGIGAAVYQLVSKDCHHTVRIDYSVEVKATMIMKAQNLFSRARVEFDAGCTDIIASFVAIKKTLTASGRSVTFKAGRGATTSHADIAWATMHIFLNEPLDGKAKAVGTMEIF